MAVISLCCLTEAVFIEFHNTLSECSAGAKLTQIVTHTWLIFLAEEQYQSNICTHLIECICRMILKKKLFIDLEMLQLFIDIL